MTWAQRLKRVFGIDIETCPACGGAMRIIACIEDPEVIEKILAHLDAKASEPEAPLRPPRCGRRAERRRSGGCSTRRGDPTMTSFGLCRQRRGNGVARPEHRRERGEVCRRGRRWGEFRAVTPISTLMGKPAWPADGRCPGRSGETARCEPPKRWFILPMRPRNCSSSASLSLRTSVPEKKISPLSMIALLASRRITAHTMVDLPEPLSPTMPRMELSGTMKLTSRNA